MSIAEVSPHRQPEPLSMPATVRVHRCDCGGYTAKALPYVAAAELRAMAGELLARNDVARETATQFTGYHAAWVLTARADELEGNR